MARVLRGPSARARRAPSRAAQRKVRTHKVVLESVTQQKRKLLSVVCSCGVSVRVGHAEQPEQISFEAKAPRGYTFIPAGNPRLTTACKERCRKEGLRILAVTVRHKIILLISLLECCSSSAPLDHPTSQHPRLVAACPPHRIPFPEHRCCSRLSRTGNASYTVREGVSLANNG